uniref:Uncharacterized protein n=1 Tax=Ascaris lumbricoides TaxID=6252 RepID=A0A0M3HLT7_ASCLU
MREFDNGILKHGRVSNTIASTLRTFGRTLSCPDNNRQLADSSRESSFFMPWPLFSKASGSFIIAHFVL